MAVELHELAPHFYVALGLQYRKDLAVAGEQDGRDVVVAQRASLGFDAFLGGYFEL